MISPEFVTLNNDEIVIVVGYIASLSNYRSEVEGAYDECVGRGRFSGLTHDEILRSLSEPQFSPITTTF